MIQGTHQWEYSVGLSTGSAHQSLVVTRMCKPCGSGENSWLEHQPLTPAGGFDLEKAFADHGETPCWRPDSSVEGLVPEGGLRLPATGLETKFGFSDGDMPDEVRDAFPGADWRKVLIRLVREFLLPKLPGVEVLEIHTAHNPIRLLGELLGETLPEELEDVVVTVPWATVFDYCSDAMNPTQPKED